MDADAFKAAVRSPDRRVQLEALRDKLAEELAEPRAGMAIAPIAKELREVMAELLSLPDETKKDSVVDIRAAIARKQAAAGL